MGAAGEIAELVFGNDGDGGGIILGEKKFIDPLGDAGTIRLDGDDEGGGEGAAPVEVEADPAFPAGAYRKLKTFGAVEKQVEAAPGHFFKGAGVPITARIADFVGDGAEAGAFVPPGITRLAVVGGGGGLHIDPGVTPAGEGEHLTGDFDGQPEPDFGLTIGAGELDRIAEVHEGEGEIVAGARAAPEIVILGAHFDGLAAGGVMGGHIGHIGGLIRAIPHEGVDEQGGEGESGQEEREAG